MHILQNYFSRLLLVLLVLLLVACQSIDGVLSDIVVPLSPLAEPTVISAPTVSSLSLTNESMPITGALYLVDPLADEQSLTSYKVVMRNERIQTRQGEKWSTSGFELQAGYRAYDDEQLPDQFHVVKLLNDSNGPDPILAGLYQIGDQSFGSGMGTSWQSTPRRQLPNEMGGPLLGLGTILSPLGPLSLPELEALLNEPPSLLDVETINGVETYHYQYLSNDSQSVLQLMQSKNVGDFQLETLSIDLWISPEDNLIIKAFVEGSGKSNGQSNGGLLLQPDGFIDRATYELSNVNTDYVIDVPAEVVAEVENFRQAGQTGELIHPRCSECLFPIPVSSIVHGYDSMGSFKIAAPLTVAFDDVRDFYTEMLPEHEWTIESSQIEHSTAMFEVTNGQQKFRVYISQNNAGESVEISIN